MSSPFREVVRRAAAALLLLFSGSVLARDLIVCADPDNLPFSQRDGSGFENRIAELIAKDLDARLVYRWQPLLRGALRKTIGAGLCDVLAGVPADPARRATTDAYYRSGYAFVTRRGWGPPLSSFDDPRLRTAKVGVPLLGADGAAAPAALALARHGVIDHVTGFPVYGASPVGQRMVEALADGRIDIAVLWGPQAGYFAAQARESMTIALAPAEAGTPQTFAIAMAVRADEDALRDEINAALARERPQIAAILAEYHLPLLAVDDARTHQP